MTNPGTTQPVERELEAIYHAPSPDRPFVENLETDLLVRCDQIVAAREAAPTRRPTRRLRRGLVPAALALVLAMTVIAVGPQRVLSALLGVTGYIPDFGFVYAPTTRVLVEPTTVQLNDGLELRVEQLVAGVDRTVMTVALEGPGVTEETWKAFARREGVEVALVHPQGFHYRLMDAMARTSADSVTDGISGYWVFTRLPQSMKTMMLELIGTNEADPLLAPGEVRKVPLAIEAAANSDGNVETAHVQALGITSQEGSQCTLTVNGAAYSITQTRVDVRARCGPNTGARLGRKAPTVLTDDAGRVYTEIEELTGQELIASGTDVQTFPAVASDARTLTLKAERLLVVDRNRHWREPFTIDLGPDPQIGQRWPLDIKLNGEDAPFDLRISQAALHASTMHEDKDPAAPYALDVTIEARGIEPDLTLEATTIQFVTRPSALPSWGGHYWVARVASYDDGVVVLRGAIPLAALPEEPFDLKTIWVVYQQQGPWEVSWEIERTP